MPKSSVVKFFLLTISALMALACTTISRIVAPPPIQVTRVVKVLVSPTPTPTELAITPQVITATPAPTPTPDLDAIQTSLEEVLDLYAEAYNENDRALLESITDADNRPFRRLVLNRFDAFQSSVLPGQYRFSLSVASIEPRPFGFIAAQVHLRGGAAANWLFRSSEDGRWLLSEPSVEQLGAAQTITTEHFIFETYPWADDVNPEIMRMMTEARDQVQTVLGRVPTQTAHVKIYPIYGLTPGDDPGAIARYFAGGGRNMTDTIEVYSPHSYVYGWFSAEDGWEPDLLMTLAHEYAHMAHRRSFNNAGHLNTWLVEGLAEYVSGATGRMDEVCEAVQTDNIIPLIDQTSIAHPQDLMHLESLRQDISLGYGLSHSLVTYITETYGGLEAVWKYADEYDKVTNPEKALQAAFGVNYTTFDKEWRAWLKEQCR